MKARRRLRPCFHRRCFGLLAAASLAILVLEYVPLYVSVPKTRFIHLKMQMCGGCLPRPRMVPLPVVIASSAGHVALRGSHVEAFVSHSGHGVMACASCAGDDGSGCRKLSGQRNDRRAHVGPRVDPIFDAWGPPADKSRAQSGLPAAEAQLLHEHEGHQAAVR